MKERLFIQKAKSQIALEEFVRKQFSEAKCGAIEIQHTPIVTRIVIYTTTPGLVIGSGGERIKETTEVLKNKFKIENPQIDVQKISNPDMNPYIIAQSIAIAIESGVNYKKLGNYYLSRVMEAGAIGCEIIFSGKLAGERSRKERFVAGYLKKCGDPAVRDVAKGFAVATPRLGNVGITVMITLRHLKNLVKKVEEKEALQPEKEEAAKSEEVVS